MEIYTDDHNYHSKGRAQCQQPLWGLYKVYKISIWALYDITLKEK